MDKFVIRKPRSVESSNIPNGTTNSEIDSSSKRPRIMFSPNDIVAEVRSYFATFSKNTKS